MRSPTKQFDIWLLFSPVTVACLSASLSIVAFALPESTYFSTLGEPKFVQWQVPLYVLTSLGLFLIGYCLPARIVVSIKVEEVLKRRRAGELFVSFVTMLLLLLTLANVYAIATFAAQYGPTSLLQFAAQGQLASPEILGAYLESSSGVSWIVLAAPPIISLAFWINWRKHSRLIPTFLLYSATLLSIIRPALRGDRGALFVLLFSLAWLYVYYVHKTKKLSAIKAVFAAVLIVSVSMALFFLFQYARAGSFGNTLGSSPGSQLFGYIIGPYNRFASQIVWGGPIPTSSGYYTFEFVRSFPIVNKLLPLEEWAQMLTGFTPPYDPFGMWSYYDLNPYYNVISAFGYTYVDFGWLGVSFFAVYGLLTRIVVNSLHTERVFGIMMCGPLVWTISEWRGKLEVTYYNFAVQVLLASLIAAVALFLINFTPTWGQLATGSHRGHGKGF
jgi:oligosaccharide repeat unit polymerase